MALRSLTPLEHRAQDALLRKHAATRAPDPDVILVTIDEGSLEAMAPEFGTWPWPRSVLAELIGRLHQYGAAAIVPDILFVEPQVDREAEDTFLIETAAATGN